MAEAAEPMMPDGAAEVTGELSADMTGALTLGVHGGGAHTGEVPPGFEGIDTHVLDAAPRARLSEEEKFEREVTRRRQAELDRRLRIFDAKRRTIGVDKAVLDAQVAEKTERLKALREAQRAEDRQFMGVNRELQLLEKEKNAMRVQAEKYAREFSMQNLNFASRDVFDLNDPKAVAKDVPARLGDDDPRLGPASMQKFNGEDLLRDERLRQQSQAMLDTLQQQVFEKKMLQVLGDADRHTFAQQAQEVISIRNEIEADEMAQRKEIMSGYKAELQAKTLAAAEAKSAEQMRTQAENQRELDFHAADPFLQETRPHIMPNGKALPSLYKGATRSERVEVFGQQREQCVQNSLRRAGEGAEDRDYALTASMTRKALVMAEREKQRMKRAMEKHTAEHNLSALAARKAAAAEAGPDGHKNKVHPEFFEQFGVGTR